MPRKNIVSASKGAKAAKPTAAKAKLTAERAFKTKWFNRKAEDEGIADQELCKAFKEVMKGQADDLGGGVWKKRLNDNMHRSIVLAKGSKYWIYAFLFAKKDRENIDEKELREFKKLAKIYGAAKEAEIGDLLKRKELVEICHDCEE